MLSRVAWMSSSIVSVPGLVLTMSYLPRYWGRDLAAALAQRGVRGGRAMPAVRAAGAQCALRDQARRAQVPGADADEHQGDECQCHADHERGRPGGQD